MLSSIRGLNALLLLSLAAGVCASSSTSSEDGEIICSPKNESDCYPRIFEPTKDFQVIREGQDLPPGLHVQMDIYSGLKQARLNIPMEGEEGAIDVLTDIPTEKAIVVIEQPEEEDTVPEQSAMRDQVPIKPPVYETAGKIPPPPPGGDDFGIFQKAMLSIRMEARSFDSALDDLKDLSHDIYYGVEIAKDGPVVEKLVCLMLGSGSEKIPAGENGRDHKAASILASAVQNNPTALKEVGDVWQTIMYPTCGNVVAADSKSNFVSILRSRLDRELDPSALKSKIAALSGLLKEPLIRTPFLENKGRELLLAIYLTPGAQFDIVRKRIAELVTDIFLDESMGAELGVWPKETVSERKVCESNEGRLDGSCWEYHVGEFARANPGKGWPEEFLEGLRVRRRGKSSAVVGDREL